MFRAAVAVFLLAATAPAVDYARALHDAAAAGDRAKFEILLRKAQLVVDSMHVGAARNRLRRAVIVATDLDRVWQFDAMYWDEQSLPDYYDRLANEYPGFGTFIAEFRLIDATSRVFYPKRETQDFLLGKLRDNLKR